jgi:DNA-binding NarL/FixJ family response regulator
MRLVVVDDHEIVREGLRATLSRDGDVEIVGDAASATEALRVLRQTLPDVVLVDFRLPGMSGDELCRRIQADFPSTAVVVLTTYLSEEIVRQVASAGAHGFVTKAAGLSALRAALRSAAASEPSMLTQCPAAAVVRSMHACTTSGAESSVGLTPQQERVLELTVDGFTYMQIAERLFISESTVRFHIQRLKERLGAKSKAELIAKAIRGALVSPDGGQDVV